MGKKRSQPAPPLGNVADNDCAKKSGGMGAFAE
jgi:hypothetical protein